MANFFHLVAAQGRHLEDGAGGRLRPPCAALREYEKRNNDHPTVLELYVSNYDARKTGTLVVAGNNNLLTLKAGNQEYVPHPESESVLSPSTVT